MNLILLDLLVSAEDTVGARNFLHGVESLPGVINPEEQPGDNDGSLHTDGVVTSGRPDWMRFPQRESRRV